MIATASLLVIAGAVLLLVGTARDGIAWELGAVVASIGSLAALALGVVRARRRQASSIGGPPAPSDGPG